MSEIDPDAIYARWLSKVPGEDGFGDPDANRGLRQMEGADGGLGSYSVPNNPVNISAPGDPGAQPTTSGGPDGPPVNTIDNVIITFNGTPYYCALNGTINGPV